MKRSCIATFLLALFVLAVSAAPAFAASLSDAEKEARYQEAVLELEAYLAGGQESAAELQEIVNSFKALGSYEYSLYFRYYALVLLKVSGGEYDLDMESMLSALEYNAGFEAYLEENRQNAEDFAIVAYGQLNAYIRGRRAETEEDSSEAMARYRECAGFYDADIRYDSLFRAQSAPIYEEAAALLEAGDYAGAYWVFSRIASYEDSGEQMRSIEHTLGYIPENENDNPKPVTGLAVDDIVSTEITLTWDGQAHATGYEVAWRESGPAGISRSASKQASVRFGVMQSASLQRARM